MAAADLAAYGTGTSKAGGNGEPKAGIGTINKG